MRGQHHDHVPAVLLRRTLDHTQLGDVVGQPLQEPVSEFRSGLLPTAEHDGHLDLVPCLEEAHDVTLLGLVVVGIDLRPELHLLDDGQHLVTTRLPGFLRTLVLELSIVHELADRGSGLRRDLHQIEVGLLRKAHGLADRHDADLLTLGADEPDLGNADPVVDAWFDAD